MKKIIFLCIALGLMADAAYAQRFLDRLQDAARNAAENAVTRNVEKKVEDKVDDAFNGGESNSSSRRQRNGRNEAGSSGEAGENAEEGAVSDGPVDFAAIQAKSDFKRGGTVFFNDELKGEQLGEFPSKWDLLSGSEVEVVNIKGVNAIKMEGGKIQPLMEEKYYLQDVLKVENS